MIQYLLARVLGGFGRWVVLAGAVWWGVSTVLVWPEVIRRTNTTLVRLPSLAFALVTTTFGLVSAILVVGVVCSTIALLVFGRVLADTVLPAALASLGVATGTSPWVGSYPDCKILRVPTSLVGTTQFRVRDDVVKDVVSRAKAAVERQLEPSTGGTPVPQAPPLLRQASIAVTVRRFGIPIATLAVLAASVGWLVRAVNGGPTTGLVLLVMIALLTLPLWACLRAAENAHAHAESPVDRSGASIDDSGTGWLIGVFGLGFVISGLLFADRYAGSDHGRLAKATIVTGATVRDEAAETARMAQQPAACRVPQERRMRAARAYLYHFDIAWSSSPGRRTSEADRFFYSKSPLPVGGPVLVRDEGGCWALAEKAGVAQSTVPVLLCVAGVGCIGVWLSRRRWRRRNQRLAALSTWR